MGSPSIIKETEPDEPDTGSSIKSSSGSSSAPTSWITRLWSRLKKCSTKRCFHCGPCCRSRLTRSEDDTEPEEPPGTPTFKQLLNTNDNSNNNHHHHHDHVKESSSPWSTSSSSKCSTHPPQGALTNAVSIPSHTPTSHSSQEGSSSNSNKLIQKHVIQEEVGLDDGSTTLTSNTPTNQQHHHHPKPNISTVLPLDGQEIPFFDIIGFNHNHQQQQSSRHQSSERIVQDSNGSLAATPSTILHRPLIDVVHDHILELSLQKTPMPSPTPSSLATTTTTAGHRNRKKSHSGQSCSNHSMVMSKSQDLLQANALQEDDDDCAQSRRCHSSASKSRLSLLNIYHNHHHQQRKRKHNRHDHYGRPFRSPANYCRVATCEKLHLHELTPKCLETFAPSSTISSCQHCSQPHIGPNHDQLMMVNRLFKTLEISHHMSPSEFLKMDTLSPEIMMSFANGGSGGGGGGGRSRQGSRCLSSSADYNDDDEDYDDLNDNNIGSSSLTTVGGSGGGGGGRRTPPSSSCTTWSSSCQMVGTPDAEADVNDSVLVMEDSEQTHFWSNTRRWLRRHGRQKQNSSLFRNRSTTPNAAANHSFRWPIASTTETMEHDYLPSRSPDHLYREYNVRRAVSSLQ